MEQFVTPQRVTQAFLRLKPAEQPASPEAYQLLASFYETRLNVLLEDGETVPGDRAEELAAYRFVIEQLIIGSVDKALQAIESDLATQKARLASALHRRHWPRWRARMTGLIQARQLLKTLQPHLVPHHP